MLNLMGLVAAATVPAFLALAGAAVQVVEFVYGDAWVPAAAALSWLVVAAMVRIFCELAYDLIVVTGRTGTVFWIQCVSLVVMVPALLGGALLGGIAGAAAAQAAVSLFVVLPLYLWQLRHVGISLVDILGRVWVPVVTGLGVGLVAWWTGIAVGNGIVALVLGAAVSLGSIGILVHRRRDSISMLKTIGSYDRTEVTP
jgi:PST family polysaccharide transporter